MKSKNEIKQSDEVIMARSRHRIAFAFLLLGTLLVLTLSFMYFFAGKSIEFSGDFDCSTGKIGLDTEYTNPFYGLNDSVKVLSIREGVWTSKLIPETTTEWQGKHFKINGIDNMRCSGSGRIKAPMIFFMSQMKN